MNPQPCCPRCATVHHPGYSCPSRAVRVDRATIEALASMTADAYSFDRYASWRGCAALLLRRGYTSREAEAILRSKHMRWAADASANRYGHVTVADLGRYLDQNAPLLTAAKLAELVAGTFGGVA